MRYLLFVLTFFYFGEAELNCPDGFDKRGNICIHTGVRTKDKGDSQNWCIRQKGHLPIIKDREANEAFANKVRHGNVWLGMTCLTENAKDCQWDDSPDIPSVKSYRNFIGGAPNLTIGPCVTLLGETGMWYSSPCTHVKNMAVCQYTEMEDDPPKVCLPPKKVDETVGKKAVADTTVVSLYRKCYFGSFVKNYADGEKFCKVNCGEVGFVQGEGGNSFMRDFPSPTTDIDFLFIKSNLTRTEEIDISVSKHYVIRDKRWGSCISMALKDEIVKRGQWVTSPCASKTSSYVICQKDPENECDRSTLPITPTKCTTPYFLNGTGTFYSPGYPGASLTNECEYFITQNSGIASISFNELVLDTNSFISLYDGVFAINPFQTLTKDNLPYYLNFQSTGNMLRMLVSIKNDDEGEGEVHVNYFRFTYSNGTNTAKDHASDL